MAIRDRPQHVILLAMLLLGVALIAGVFLDGGERGAGVRGDSNGRRVSLMEHSAEFDSAFALARPLDVARIAAARRFDYPLGSENGAMIYNAQPFREDRHLGADLNGIGGWDSDLGDPVYAAAAGRILYAGWAGEGWGNFVILAHRLEDGALLESVYGHLESIDVAVEDRVYRGQRLGSVGKGAGQYLAHLHFEIRLNPSLHPGPGYADGPLDRLAPTGFLEERRGAGATLLSSPAGGAAAGPVDERHGGLELRLGRKGGPEGEPGASREGKKTVRELRQ